jgi:choice-of-anchor A domain-containing protein
VCTATLLLVSTASGASILTPYNAIVSGTFTVTGSDSGGGIAAGGEISLGGYYQIAHDLMNEPLSFFPQSTYTYTNGSGTKINVTQGTTFLAYGGIASGSTAQIANGNFYVVAVTGETGTATAVNGNLGGQATSDPLSPSSIASEFTNFTTVSGEINRESQNKDDSAAVSGSTLTIDVNDAGLNVIDLTESQLAGLSVINFDLGNGITFASCPNNCTTTTPGNAWVIINVYTSGTTSYSIGPSSDTTVNPYSGNSYQLTGDAYAAEDILYNFSNATSLTLGYTVAGSVLAPDANVTGGVDMVGSLVAASYNGGAEFHNAIFMGPTYTPEPAPIACVGLGLLGLAYLRRRRQA